MNGYAIETEQANRKRPFPTYIKKGLLTLITLFLLLIIILGTTFEGQAAK